MAIKQGASCIDMAIHTTLLALCRLERAFFYPVVLYFVFLAPLKGSLPNAEFSESENFFFRSF